MLIPCCFSVRIQMVLVAPVRTSSSTNQIHVTHTEQKEGRKWGKSKDEENLKEGSNDTAGLYFPNFIYLYIVPMQNCITLQSRVLSIPLPRAHTHMHGLSAKKPLPNYLPLAKALQPRSTILGPTLDKDRGQRDARSGGTFCCFFFKKRHIGVWKERVW